MPMSYVPTHHSSAQNLALFFPFPTFRATPPCPSPFAFPVFSSPLAVNQGTAGRCRPTPVCSKDEVMYTVLPSRVSGARDADLLDDWIASLRDYCASHANACQFPELFTSMCCAVRCCGCSILLLFAVTATASSIHSSRPISTLAHGNVYFHPQRHPPHPRHSLSGQQYSGYHERLAALVPFLSLSRHHDPR